MICFYWYLWILFVIGFYSWIHVWYLPVQMSLIDGLIVSYKLISCRVDIIDSCCFMCCICTIWGCCMIGYRRAGYSDSRSVSGRNLYPRCSCLLGFDVRFYGVGDPITCSIFLLCPCCRYLSAFSRFSWRRGARWSYHGRAWCLRLGILGSRCPRCSRWVSIFISDHLCHLERYVSLYLRFLWQWYEFINYT